jgi:hypothetical protein
MDLWEMDDYETRKHFAALIGAEGGTIEIGTNPLGGLTILHKHPMEPDNGNQGKTGPTDPVGSSGPVKVGPSSGAESKAFCEDEEHSLSSGVDRHK